MSWVLDAAVVLNEGKRRDALINLASIMGRSVGTIRAWESGSLEMPDNQKRFLRSILDNATMKKRLENVAMALNE